MEFLDRDVKRVLDELEKALGGVDEAPVNELADGVARANRVFVAGAGRSGLMGRAFAMRLMHMGYVSHVVGDVTTPGIAKGDLLVACTASGRTESLLSMIGKAGRIGAKVAVVTAFPDSPAARAADIVVTIPAPTPKADEGNGTSSAQPMGTMFEQALLLLLDIVVMRLMRKSGVSESEMFARHANLE